MEETVAITALAALAQEARLRIFRTLVGAGPQGLTPSTLSEMLDVPASTLSFHLKELTRSGLVTQERDSRNLIYRPAIDQMNELLAYLTAHCCQGRNWRARHGLRGHRGAGLQQLLNTSCAQLPAQA